jgi:hypothetical protein
MGAFWLVKLQDIFAMLGGETVPGRKRADVSNGAVFFFAERAAKHI